MLAEILSLNVPQDSHSMAAGQARIERIRREAASAKTVSFLVARIMARIVVVFTIHVVDYTSPHLLLPV